MSLIPDILRVPHNYDAKQAANWDGELEAWESLAKTWMPPEELATKTRELLDSDLARYFNSLRPRGVEANMEATGYQRDPKKSSTWIPDKKSSAYRFAVAQGTVLTRLRALEDGFKDPLDTTNRVKHHLVAALWQKLRPVSAKQTATPTTAATGTPAVATGPTKEPPALQTAAMRDTASSQPPDPADLVRPAFDRHLEYLVGTKLELERKAVAEEIDPEPINPQYRENIERSRNYDRKHLAKTTAELATNYGDQKHAIEVAWVHDMARVLYRQEQRKVDTSQTSEWRGTGEQWGASDERGLRALHELVNRMNPEEQALVAAVYQQELAEGEPIRPDVQRQIDALIDRGVGGHQLADELSKIDHWFPLRPKEAVAVARACIEHCHDDRYVSWPVRHAARVASLDDMIDLMREQMKAEPNSDLIRTIEDIARRQNITKPELRRLQNVTNELVETSKNLDRSVFAQLRKVGIKLPKPR